MKLIRNFRVIFVYGTPTWLLCGDFSPCFSLGGSHFYRRRGLKILHRSGARVPKVKRCGILPDESKGVTMSQLIVNGKFQAFITSIFAWKIKICANTIVVKLDSVWPNSLNFFGLINESNQTTPLKKFGLDFWLFFEIPDFGWNG